MWYAFFLFPLVSLFSLFLSSNWALAASSVEISALAVVGRHVITSRELALHYFLNRQLSLADKSKNPKVAQLLNENNKGLQELVAQWAIKLEADSFAIIGEKATATESKLVIDNYLSAAKKDPAVSSLEINHTEIIEALGRRKQVEEFLRLKSDTRSVVVTEEELKAEFEKNKIKLGDSKPLSQFRDQVRESLAREKARAQIADWVDLIQRKYKVRILSDNKTQ